MTKLINEYEKQALDFLEATKTELTVEYLGDKINCLWGDKEPRRCYNVTLSNERGSETFEFWGSLYDTEIMNMNFEDYSIKQYHKKFEHLTGIEQHQVQKELKKVQKEAETPSYYSILASLYISEMGTFKDFCSDFGYDTDSIKAYKTYILCIEEEKKLQKLFTRKELEMLSEIQ